MSKKNFYLVPFDFTPTAEKALEYAIFLSKKKNAEICLFHIVSNRAKGIKKAEELKTIIEKFKPNLPLGSEITFLIKEGNIFTDIGTTAKEKNATLVIMGTHGVKGTQILFGAFAIKVLKHSETPFIIVQEETAIQEVEKIIFAVDLTKESLQAAPISAYMSRLYNANVIIVAEKQYDSGLAVKIASRISIVKEKMEEVGAKVEVNYLDGRGAFDKKVIRFAKENNAGIISLAYHSESLLPQFDTFAQNIINNKLKLPVIIVNSKQASVLYF